MSQILVWKSDADGKLFEDKNKYQAHLRKLARERAHQKKLQAARDAKKKFIHEVLSQVKTIAELEKCIKDNFTWFFYNGLEHQWSDSKNTHKVPHQLHKITFNVHWDNSVSNSHSCPRGGVTNWGGRTVLEDGSPAPRGYPGWRGNMVLEVITEKYKYRNKEYYRDGFGGDYFKETGINTGTGGGGGEKDGITRYQYGIELFASDFPQMHLRKQKSENWQAMGGRNWRLHDVKI